MLEHIGETLGDVLKMINDGNVEVERPSRVWLEEKQKQSYKQFLKRICTEYLNQDDKI